MCAVTTTMAEKAITGGADEAGSDGKMECQEDASDTDVARSASTQTCCWWGRGAIQVTGPKNVGHLHSHIVKGNTHFNVTRGGATSESAADLCAHPEDICRHEELKWISGLHWWAEGVQKSQEQCDKNWFDLTRDAFVAENWSREDSRVKLPCDGEEDYVKAKGVDQKPLKTGADAEVDFVEGVSNSVY